MVERPNFSMLIDFSGPRSYRTSEFSTSMQWGCSSMRHSTAVSSADSVPPKQKSIQGALTGGPPLAATPCV